MNRNRRSLLLSFFSLLGAVLVWFTIMPPSQAHWADMSAAEIAVEQAAVQITLTYPTGLTPFADDNQNGHLSIDEVRAHAASLKDFLGQSIRLTDTDNQPGNLTIHPLEQGPLPATIQATPNTHSTVKLTYAWPKPIEGIKIHYNLFLAGIPTANCLATILQNHQLKTFVFTPQNQFLALTSGSVDYTLGGLLAIVGAVVWGAMHSLSPGHGKTLVGAYLIGTRATPRHAIFLAVTTTITHTIGIFALGLLTLFASRYILPEQLYPWLNLLSGLMVVGIGFHLLWSRSRGRASHHSHSHPHGHSHISNDYESLDHQHRHFALQPLTSLSAGSELHDHTPHSIYHTGCKITHSALHSHHHTHDHPTDHKPLAHHEHDDVHQGHMHHHGHSHLPPGTEGPVTWRSLLALGISGGLVPCPAALVLLLSCIALGNVSLGLLLVLAFSLGLAGVLTVLGLLLVYAKQLFRHFPAPKRASRLLPALSGLGITVIGFGLSTQAVMQIMGK